MRLDDLGTFVEVARGTSITAAAARLGLPKSTVSRRVTRLERDLEETLLHRLPRRVELTEVGQGLYERSVDAIDTLRRAAADVLEAHDELAGDLRVSLPHDLGLSQHMVRLLTDFRAAHPRISLAIDLSERRVDLLEEHVDFAFRAHLRPLPSTDALKAVRLAKMGGGLFAAPSYLRNAPPLAAPEDLTDHEFVSPELGPGIRAFQMTCGEASASIALEGGLQATSVAFLPAAAAAGAGVAYVPFFAAEAFVARGELVRVLSAWEAPAATLSLLWPATRLPHPRRRAFVAFVRERFRQEANS